MRLCKIADFSFATHVTMCFCAFGRDWEMLHPWAKVDFTGKGEGGEKQTGRVCIFGSCFGWVHSSFVGICFQWLCVAGRGMRVWWYSSGCSLNINIGRYVWVMCGTRFTHDFKGILSSLWRNVLMVWYVAQRTLDEWSSGWHLVFGVPYHLWSTQL